MRAFKPGLRFRLLFLVVGVALICLLASIFLLFNFQRKQLIENSRASTAALSNLVEANLHHAMVTGDWGMVNELIEAAAAEDTIDTVRVLSPQGNVHASSNRNELGLRFGPQDPICQQCHADSSPPQDQTIVFNSPSGRQTLLNVNLIHNEPECWICHPPNQQVLGLLMIETPLTPMNNQLARGVWQTTLLALAACGLLVGLLVPALNRFVLQPVEALSRGVDELASGNLGYEVNAVNQDELGKLAESFDQMRQQLKSSYTEIGRREKEAATLYRLGTKISANLALPDMLESVAEAARELLGADIGLVGLFDEESQEIVMKAAAGTQAALHKGMRMPVCRHTPGSALLEGLPVIAEAFDQNNLLHPDNSLISAERIVNILAVPLQFGDKFLGVIEVMSRDQKQFTPADAQLLTRLAHHVVVSIENAHLYQQLRYLAGLEERDRLAREMHDRLAQTLGYLNIRAAMIDDLLCCGQIDEAKASLAEMKRAAKMAYTDVREEIFNLRTSVSLRVGLLPTLQKYLSEYHTHYGLEVELLYEHESLTEFPAEVASQLLRILQEALTNVRKHACASRASIRFQQEVGRVCILVEDNGQGFYPDQSSEKGRQSYGLQIMRERAECVGGSLSVDSQPGRGTRVILCVPNGH